MKVRVLVAQSCPAVCDLMDFSLPGSSVHEILQARILEWVAISYSRGSSQPRDQTQVSYIASGLPHCRQALALQVNSLLTREKHLASTKMVVST